MDFRLIHNRKLRVVLSAEDMLSMNLRYDAMELDDPATRAALLFLLERAEGETGFRPDGARLFIEAFAGPEGGCVLFLTLLPFTPGGKRGKAGVAPVVFWFDGLESASRAAAGVRERLAQRIHKSALYKFGDTYRLVIYPLDYADRLSVAFLSEYGAPVAEGDLAAAHAEEHGEEIFRDNAIDMLASLSC